MCKVPNPITVRQELDPAEQKRYTEQKNNRDAQLSAAQRLNWISGGGVVLGIASLFGVGLTLWQNRQVMEIDQRAWIAPSSVTPHRPYEASHLAITIRYANTGKTPGYIDSIATRVGFADSANHIRLVDWISSGPDTLAPNQPEPITLTAKPISDQEFELLKGGKLGLAFSITVYYHDAFGKARTTENCVMLIGPIENMTDGQILPTCGPTKMT
jgi:hypothetical protein